jgi:hypothetical protein
MEKEYNLADRLELADLFQNLVHECQWGSVYPEMVSEWAKQLNQFVNDKKEFYA